MIVSDRLCSAGHENPSPGGEVLVSRMAPNKVASTTNGRLAPLLVRLHEPLRH